jgi:hypothetical protein
MVFSFKGQAIEQLSTAAWYKALKRAGIEDFRWHDLRTPGPLACPSRHPALRAARARGWASYAMVQRYAHLAADHLAPWAERLRSATAQIRHNANGERSAAAQIRHNDRMPNEDAGPRPATR